MLFRFFLTLKFKAMAKKRIMSQTEKTLRGKLKYQRSLNSKEVKSLSKDMQENFFRISTKTKGSTTKKSTDYWERNKAIMKRNKTIEELENKLKRFKYKKRVPKKIDTESNTIEPQILGHAWEVSEFYETLKFVKFYQGVPIGKSRRQMQSDLINEVLLMNDSTDILWAIIDSFENLLYFEIR